MLRIYNPEDNREKVVYLELVERDDGVVVDVLDESGSRISTILGIYPSGVRRIGCVSDDAGIALDSSGRVIVI
jgi:hypothetical protein